MSLRILLALLLAAASASPQERIEAPKYREGDFWQFRITQRGTATKAPDQLEGDYEVLYSNGKLQFFRLRGGREHITRGVAELRQMLASGREGTSYLQFPLFVGKKWTTRYRSQGEGSTRGGRAVVRTAESRVERMDVVATPAGSFRAAQITRLEPSPARLINTTYFYSPETRSIVQFHFSSVPTRRSRALPKETDIELIKFGSGSK